MIKLSRYFKIPINAKQLSKFMDVGNSFAKNRIDVADQFASRFLSSSARGFKLSKPKAPNPGAASKIWPMK